MEELKMRDEEVQYGVCSLGGGGYHSDAELILILF